MSDWNAAFSIHIRLVIDFSTMKENSKGSIKGDVCCTRACVWSGLEQCRGWKLWILVPGAGSEKHRLMVKVSGWLWGDTNGWKMFKEKYPKATLIYLCLARTNKNCLYSSQWKSQHSCFLYYSKSDTTFHSMVICIYRHSCLLRQGVPGFMYPSQERGENLKDCSRLKPSLN